MAFKIPKIQYSNVDTTGTTANGSGVITSVGTTVGVANGMFVRGANIPAGAKVGSFTSNTITLASGVLCTGVGTGEAIALGIEIVFAYPPVETGGEMFETKATVTESLSGVQQTSVNYIEASRKFVFSFLSETLKTSVDTFLTTYALLGNSFRYYEDQTLTPYTTYQIKTLKAAPVKRAPVGQDVYNWDYPLDFRRAT